MGEERDRICADDIAKVENEGYPGVFETCVEVEVISESKDGGLAEDGFVVVLEGVGEAELAMLARGLEGN